MCPEETAKSLMAVCSKERIRSTSALSHVYITPIEDLGEGALSLWGDKSAERQFNVRLGKAASAYLERELKNRSRVLAASEQKDIIDIGISGGSTVHAAVRHLQNLKLGSGVRISPLVLGPLPQMRYAAETIGAILQERLERSTLDSPLEITISDPSALTSTPEIRLHINDGKKAELAERQFDWLITGVGGTECVSYHAALGIVCPTLDCLPTAVGNVFSRFFGKACEELEAKKLDAFVPLGLEDLASLARRSETCRVIAIAGGVTKVEALKTLLRVGECRNQQSRTTLLQRGGRLLNTLITDDLTAMAIMR